MQYIQKAIKNVHNLWMNDEDVSASPHISFIQKKIDHYTELSEQWNVISGHYMTLSFFKESAAAAQKSLYYENKAIAIVSELEDSNKGYLILNYISY